jgi:membrane-bound metal-dependent hydrolase YbcI (DUF457 family)
MIAGHFGFAALVKSRERQCPLWALMLASVWLDVVFVPLFLTGVETMQPAPGATGSYGAAIIHADYTHSLVGALLLSALFGLAGWAAWGRRNGVVLGLVAFSHWVLDLLVHRADMPILPGDFGHLPRLGLGLWRIPPAAISAELALVLAGAWFYWRAARAVALTAGRGAGRARVAGLLMLVFGVGVLALDATGVFG